MVAERPHVLPEPIYTPETIRDPYPVYGRLRAAGPVCREPVNGNLLVTRYADVAAVLKHPRISSVGVVESAIHVPPLFRPVIRPVQQMLARQMLFSDPP